MNIDKISFREYDIRGIYPSQIDEEGAFFIGAAISTFLKKNNLGSKIIVGHDNRLSSKSLYKKLISGLVHSGADVSGIDLSLTPIIHYLTCTNDFDFGILVTASHNPSEYNGFRLDYKGAVPFYGDQIQDLYSIIEKKEFLVEKGSFNTVSLNSEYFEYLYENFEFKDKYKIALNLRNGTISSFIDNIFLNSKFEVYKKFDNSDGSYPNGIADPELPETKKEISEFVLESNADIGFSFDVDCDRFNVVDERGFVYETDKLMLLFAKYLSDFKFENVYFDVKSSIICEQEIRKLGKKPKRIRTGHPFFVRNVQKDGFLGAEYSGHVYFGNPYFGYDDGIFAAFMVLNILQSEKRPLSELMSYFSKTYHTHEMRVKTKDGEEKNIVSTFLSISKSIPNVYRIDQTEGVRVYLDPSSCFLVRASNTSPCISTKFEALTKNRVYEMIEIFKNIMTNHSNLDLSPFNSCEIIHS